jgi:hypothetical protein
MSDHDKINAKINAKLDEMKREALFWDKRSGESWIKLDAALRRALEVEHEMFYITPRMRSLRWAKAKRDIVQILEGE